MSSSIGPVGLRCRSRATLDADAQRVVNEAINALRRSGVPGARGMIAKLADVANLVHGAVTGYDAGVIDAATYLGGIGYAQSTKSSRSGVAGV